MKIDDIRNFRHFIRILERESGGLDDAECCGLTLAQCHTIMELGKTGEIASIELASLMGIDPSTLSRHINGLVNLGYVNRVPNPGDRRYVTLSLTETGRQTYESLDATCNLYYDKIFALIPLEKHAQVLEGFTLFTEALMALKGQELECCTNTKCSNTRCPDVDCSDVACSEGKYSDQRPETSCSNTQISGGETSK